MSTCGALQYNAGNVRCPERKEVMPKIVQNNHDDAIAERAADAHSEEARNGVEAVRKSAGLAAPSAADEREPAPGAIEGTTELGALIAALFAEQTRHSIEVAATLGRARNWGEVAHAQNEFIAGSFQRMGQLSDRYVAFIRTGIKVISSPSPH
jgi:hypothetical protein